VSARVGHRGVSRRRGDGDTIVRNAEAAARKAKARGERYLLCTRNVREDRRDARIENELRQALENDEFVSALPTERSTCRRGASWRGGLIRWQSPKRGLVPPLQSSVMEETRNILERAWAMRRM